MINDIKSKDREISAIYDSILALNCNNNYLCVWESSFSYFVLTKIDKIINNAHQIQLTNLDDEIQKIVLKY
jgi:hypothetical protein